jgi:hypothetical protein
VQSRWPQLYWWAEIGQKSIFIVFGGGILWFLVFVFPFYVYEGGARLFHQTWETFDTSGQHVFPRIKDRRRFLRTFAIYLAYIFAAAFI